MSRRPCTECGGLGNREGIECERCDGSGVEPLTAAERRATLLRAAEEAGRRGDMAGRVEAVAALVQLIPEPPPPVLPALRGRVVARRREVRHAA